MTPICLRAHRCVRIGLTLGLLGACAPLAAQIEVTEATIGELQEAMESGRATSAEITAAYLARIDAYDQAGQPPSGPSDPDRSHTQPHST